MVLRIVCLLTVLCCACGAAERDTEASAALDGALKFLIARQHLNGSWTLQNGGSPVGMTSYALMAFLAADAAADRGPYARQVALAIRFLTDSVADDGLIYREAYGQFPHNLYDQGSATIVLAEVCARGKDEAIRTKVARAAGFIMGCQDASGGWKFKPVATERPDLPVTALQLSALCAAREVGVQAPQSVIDRGVAFILRCRDERTGGFAYTPAGSNPGPSRTASAVFALQVCGIRDDRIARGANYLLQEPTPAQRDEQGLWFAYGRYYTGFALHLRSGEAWNRWYGGVRGELLRSARRKGDEVCWDDPTSNPPDPQYITALDATLLALPGNHLRLWRGILSTHEKP